MMDEKLVHNIVMDEELVQSIVMDEKFVKNFVIVAKIDPKVEMGPSMFEIGGLNILQLSNRKLLEEFIEEAVTAELLVGTLSRGSVLVMHYAVTSTREGLHGMMQCYRQQHFVASDDLHERPRGHASWREPSMSKFTEESYFYFVKGPLCRWTVQKMQSESSEHVRKTTGFFTDSWRIQIALWRATLKSMLWKFGRETG